MMPNTIEPNSVEPKALDQQFVVLDRQQRATFEPVDAQLYQRLAENYDDFQGHMLVSSYQFHQDWTQWEIHPAGDEVVILLSGEATILLEHTDGVSHITLRHANDTCIIPCNTWHTAQIAKDATLLFVTPGAGTRHRAL